ncbi:alcohol dehydrogenase catalytic domain-containing protein [Scytonema sp. NUACC26]|uniref:alcohol dehydrogenase catalytic domain-containing protein n=1 Tax=Scytonema sp. NUACC26 TaxID=3140176 RepID=UPI0034DC3C76
MLIRIAATSVNPVDCKLRQGVVVGIAPDFPSGLHGDVAIAIEAFGEGVTAFQLGVDE